MSLEELELKIKALGLPDNWLSVNGPDGQGANIVFFEYNKKWRVYENVDRGMFVYDETFIHKEDAFDYACMQAEKVAKYYRR